MERIRLIDVGARNGIHERWEPYHDRIEVRAFEPDRAECDRLNRQTWPFPIRFLPTALGANDGEQATLYICRQPGCSSLLRPNLKLCDSFEYARNMEVTEQRPILLSRLDTVCADFSPDVLKIDTQGTELSILQGAGTLLDSSLAVELELEFIEQYTGQPLFADVDAFMRSKGLMLRGLRRTCWRNRASCAHAHGGQLISCDALYIRPEGLNTPKGHVVLAAYRQYDLLASFGAGKHIPKESRIIRVLGRLLAGYPNRELRRFVDRIRPTTASDWHDPDFF
jgi:FkbM family methyltransferase